MLLGMMIADGVFLWPLPQSSRGIFVRSVHALFHSDICAASPQAAQMHTYHTSLRCLESTFRFLLDLEHAMILASVQIGLRLGPDLDRIPPIKYTWFIDCTPLNKESRGVP